MRIYLASSWRSPTDSPVFKNLYDECLDQGHEITSKWITAARMRPTPEYEMPLDDREEERWVTRAVSDMRDICRSDGMIVILDRERGTGHHIEFGYALSHRMEHGHPHIVLTGDRPWSVFHKTVPYYESPMTALTYLEIATRKGESA